MAAAQLAVRISAQLAEFQAAFRDASKTTQKFQEDFAGIATRAATVGAFIGTIAADIASSLGRGLVNTFSSAITASNEFNAAFMGLSSVASAFGTSADEAKAAAQKLAADGLLPIKDAATGLKNLLAAGFSLPEATKLMEAFKDSAAFGRQGALSFGDAVRSATEGVKNGNSILVDNAGITKNLSQILKEAGFSAQDLSKASSDAGVRQALLNGILKEAAAFTGDAERLTKTYAGTLASLGASWQLLLATWGDVITQNQAVAVAMNAVREAFNGVVRSLEDNRKGFLFVADALLLFVRGLASLINVIDLVQTAFAAFQRVANNLGATVADLGIAFFKFQEAMAGVMKYLDPTNFSRHARAVEEAKAAYTFLQGAVKGFDAASADAQTRSIVFGNALQGVVGHLRTLEKGIAEARGKTIEYGTTTAQVNRDIVKGSGAVGEASKQMAANQKRAAQDVIRSYEDLRKSFERVFDLLAKANLGETNFLNQLSDRSDVAIDRLKAVTQAWIDLAAIINGTNLKVITGLEPPRGVEDNWQVPDERFTKGLPGFAAADKNAKDLSHSLRGLQQAVSDLGRITGSEGVQEFASFLSTLALADEAGRNLAEGFAQIKEGGMAAVKGILTAAQGVIQGIGAIAQATSSGGKGKRTASGALAGASIGANPALLAATGGWSVVVGAAAGAITGFIRAMNQGRGAIKEFAESFGGFDELRNKLAVLGEEGERLWVNLTQRVANDDLDAANEAMQAITEALAKGAPAAESFRDAFTAAGFKTRAELEETARASVDLYERMKESGLFTAGELEKAFKQSQAAIREAVAGSGQLEAMDAIKSKIGELTSEYDSLFRAVANEAPEEEMGVIERQMRERMAAIETERGGLENQLQEMTDDLQRAFGEIGGEARAAADEIRDAFANISIPPIRVPVEVEGLDIPGFASGGIVRRPTIALIGEDGPEAVVPLRAMGSAADFGSFRPDGDGDIVLTLQTILDGTIIDERIERVSRREATRLAQTGALVTRAPSRRTY
jgi:hypothetical protein